MRLIDVYPYRCYEKGIQFLILKRSEGKLYAGEWRMVAGKIKENERAWEAGLRELKEETGLSPKLYWTIPSINHFYNHRNDIVESIPAFAAETDYDDTVVLNEEHNEYRWITIEDVEDYIRWPEQRRLLKLVHNTLTDYKILEDWKISR